MFTMVLSFGTPRTQHRTFCRGFGTCLGVCVCVEPQPACLIFGCWPRVRDVFQVYLDTATCQPFDRDRRSAGARGVPPVCRQGSGKACCQVSGVVCPGRCDSSWCATPWRLRNHSSDCVTRYGVRTHSLRRTAVLSVSTTATTAVALQRTSTRPVSPSSKT